METDGKNDRLNRIETAICIIEHHIAAVMHEETKAYLKTKEIEGRIIHENRRYLPFKKRRYPSSVMKSAVPEICTEEGKQLCARELAFQLTEIRRQLIELFDKILFESNGELSES